MRVDTDRLDTPYPPKHECEVNSKTCEFSVDFLCHECGKKMCGACAVGVAHQPQFVKYSHNDDKTQAHCPECADTHSVRTEVVAGGILGVVIGLAVIGLIQSPIAIIIGLLILISGGYLSYNEYQLKSQQPL